VGEENTSSFWAAYERYRGVEITEQDIEAYIGEFKNSERELFDLCDMFSARKGDVSHMLALIIGAGDEDVPRLLAEIDKALASGKLKASKQELATLKATRSEVKTTAELDAEGAEMDEEIGDEEDEEEGGDDDDAEEDDDDGADLDGFIVNEHEEGEHEEDDEEEGSAPAAGAPPRFVAQQRVEARWRKGPTWYGAVVTKVDAKRHTYTVKYDEDGAVEEGVMEQHMRRAKPVAVKSSKRKQASTLEEEEEEEEEEETAEQQQTQTHKHKQPEPKQKQGPHKQAVKAGKKGDVAATKASPAKKARGRAGKGKEQVEYDGDLDALRAAMMKNKTGRTDGFESFAARWAGK
jgi:hypothetical protein